MSKKKIFKKHLEKGRFYIHNDRHGGHPSYLFRKRDKKNCYVVIIFTSSPGPKKLNSKRVLNLRKLKFLLFIIPQLLPSEEIWAVKF